MPAIKPNSITEEKNSLRKTIKHLKMSVDSSTKLDLSNNIFSQVEALPEFIQASTIFAYWSMPDEVQTHIFVSKWYKTKRILLPLVVGNDLELRVFSGIECLEPRPPFGILEPVKGLIANISEVDLAIVPGIAFDMSGNRMGRGKGYYDKLLTQTKIFKIGVCFSCQLVERVPTTKHDILMDKVIYS